MYDYEDNTIFNTVMGIILILFICLGFYYRTEIGNYFKEIAAKQAAEEKRFNEHCKKVGRKEGSSSMNVGFSTSGDIAFVPVYTPPQNIYQCDDGQIIIK